MIKIIFYGNKTFYQLFFISSQDRHLILVSGRKTEITSRWDCMNFFTPVFDDVLILYTYGNIS